MSDEETKSEPVKRDAKGRIVKGSKAINPVNPGGMNKERREARELLTTDLTTEPFREAFLKSYLSQLKAGNPHILKDYADRTLGKAKDTLEVQGSISNPLANVSTEDLLAFVKAKKS